MMDGDFFVAASLSTTLTKLALRYVSLTQDKKKQNVSTADCYRVMEFSYQKPKLREGLGIFSIRPLLS